MPRQSTHRRGASESSTTREDRLRGLLRHHRQLLIEALQRLLADPLQSLMTALVIAIALGLPGLFYLAVMNLQAVGNGFESTGQVTVFISREATEQQTEALQQQLTHLDGFAEPVYINPEQALQEFKSRSGFGEALTLLDENPLPGVFTLSPSAELSSNSGALKKIVTEIKTFSMVDDVTLDFLWIERLNTLLAIAEKLAFALGVALSLGVLLVVGNTIRLEIENRKEEIIVVKLVGGTDAYVRRPFLYTGLWYGLLGGLLAWLLVSVVFWTVSGTIDYLSSLYESNFAVQGAGFSGLLILLVLGGGLGLVGSWLAVARHIADMEPT